MLLTFWSELMYGSISWPGFVFVLRECFCGMESNHMTAMQKLLWVFVVIPLANEALELGLWKLVFKYILLYTLVYITSYVICKQIVT